MSTSKLNLLQDMVSDEICKCIRKVGDACNGRAPNPVVEYGNLKGRVAGRAYGHRKIEVNTAAAIVMGEAYREVAGHEYAHIVNYWLSLNFPNHKILKGDSSGRGHGRGWRSVMEFLGYEPERCYSHETASNLAAEGVYGKVYPYICSNGCSGVSYAFSQRRHNNVVERGMKYICPKCKATLVKEK